jgi:anti-sigma-K factor RskA
MSDPDHSDTPPPDDNNLVAGEYVLGVLDANERRAVAQRIESDAGLARDVAFWEERLGGLADGVRPVRPPEAMWSRIENAISAPAPAPQRGGLWNSLAFWRGLAIGTAAIAAACIAALAFIGTGMIRDERSPLLANIRQTEGGQQPGFVAAVGAGGTLVIVPASLLTADQKSMELWLIPAVPAGTTATPRSLGLIAPNQPVRITIPPQLVPLVTRDASLAVSLEEPGGSRTGVPDRVIAVGGLTNL